MNIISERQISKNIDVSVLISTFNKEKYIENTLDSLLKQSLPLEKFEVILVDDCSTDNTLNLVQSKIEGFSNFKLVQLDSNSGTPAKPRNTAIDLSIGKYTIFIDGDDWLPINSLESLSSLLSNNKTDYSTGLTEYVFDNKTGRAGVVFSKFSTNKLNIKNIKKSFYHLAPAGRMIRSSIIKKNKIRFPEMIFGEDLQFFAEVLLNIKQISTTTDVVYYANRYSENKSLVKSEDSTLANRMTWQMDAYSHLLKKYKGNINFKHVLYRFINKDIIENKFFQNRFLNNMDLILPALQNAIKVIEADFNPEDFIDNEIYKYALKLIKNGNKDKMVEFINWNFNKDESNVIIKNDIAYYEYNDKLFKKQLHVTLKSLSSDNGAVNLGLFSPNSKISFLEVKNRKFPSEYVTEDIKKVAFKKDEYNVRFDYKKLQGGKIALTVFDEDYNATSIRSEFEFGFYETVNKNLGFLTKDPNSFNLYKNRKTRNKPFARAIINSPNNKTVEAMRWSGDADGNPTFKNPLNESVSHEDIVYIYGTTSSGWGRINSPTYKGWINLEYVKITHVY